MNQQIICESCYADVRKRYPTNSPFPGEHIKFMHGLASKDYFCDLCGRDLPVACDCTAYTLWSDRGRQPYSPWEHNFLYEMEVKLE